MDKALKREKREDRLFEELQAARESRDASRYARVAQILGYNDGSKLHEELMERAAADRIFEKSRLSRLESESDAGFKQAENIERVEPESRVINEFDYDTFEREVQKYRERAGAIDLSIYNHTSTKREILRISGLSYLRVARGARVSLGEARPERVGRVFLDRYQTLQRRKRANTE